MSHPAPDNDNLCGAPGHIDEGHTDVFCDLKPFHPEDHHHAAYSANDNQSAHWWPVGTLHRIPTHLYGAVSDEPGLIDLMNELGRPRWDEITQRLAAQLGHPEKAYVLAAEAEEEINEDEELGRLRKDLHTRISDAQATVQKALHSLSLLGGRDIEYEDPETTDTWAFLSDARRMLLAAQAVMPTNADGDNK